MAERKNHAENPAVDAAETSKRRRMSKIAKNLLAWGIGTAVVAVGVLLATKLIVPVIPIAACNKAALTRYGYAAGKWLLSMGGILTGLGAGKAAIDVARA